MTPDATDKVLDAIDGLDKKIDRHNQANDERFVRIEEELKEHRDELGSHGTELKEHREQLTSHNTLLREQAQAVTTVAGTAARAVEHALAAKQDAGRSVDEATKIVESAIRMHSASIASTVTVAVNAAVNPLVAEVDTLRTNTKLQDKTLADQGVKLDAILTIAKSTASILGHKKLRVFLLVCAGLGAIGGGAMAGYYARDGAAAVSPSTHP